MVPTSSETEKALYLAELIQVILHDVKNCYGFEFDSLDRCDMLYIFLSHSPHSEYSFVKDENALDDAHRNFRDLDQLEIRVLDLLTVVKLMRKTLQENVFVPAMHHYGFKKLPVELITHIIGFLPRSQIQDCLRINRRIREIVSSTPSLWTEISTSEPLPLIKMKLDYSKDAPLHIILAPKSPRLPYRYEEISPPEEAILLCSKHSHRWHRVSFGEWARYWDVANLHVPELGSVKHLELPSFSAHVGRWRDSDFRVDRLGPCMDFHKRWTFNDGFRSVTDLTIGEDIPIVEEPFLFPALKNLRIDLKKPSLFDIDDLVPFLNGHASLRKLSILVNASRPCYDGFYCVVADPLIELPQLAEFHVSLRMKRDFRVRRAQINCFCRLVQSFKTPNVEKIELGWTSRFDSMRSGSNAAPLPRPDSLFRCNQLKKLKAFNISIAPFAEEQWDTMLGQFMRELHGSVPSLREVTCHLPSQPFDENVHLWSKSMSPTAAYLDFRCDFEKYLVLGRERERKQKQPERGDNISYNVIRGCPAGFEDAIYPA